MRDDFAEATKRALALRVGYRCSNPDCGALTSGPQDDISKAINLGVAAHITAASPSGPRFDPMLTQAERCAASNGIWLCQNCAKLVDNDEARFTIELLQQWKIEREAEARRQIGRSTTDQTKRTLRVELQLGEFVEAGVGETPVFVFRVANPHERPATIWGAGIDVPDFDISVPAIKPELLTIPRLPALPAEIRDGQGLVFSESREFFMLQLGTKHSAKSIHLIGYVTDALGNRHESNTVVFHVPERTA